MPRETSVALSDSAPLREWLLFVLVALSTLFASPFSADAAVTRTGNVTNHQPGNGNTGSTGITVPADAELMVVAAAAFANANNYYSGGTITLGGNALSVGFDADDTTVGQQGVLYYLDVRALTGSQTLAWDWSGAGTSFCSQNIDYAFYNGVDMNAPIRDSGGQGPSGSGPFTTGSMNAISGDMVAAAMSATDNTTLSWTNATQVRSDATDCNRTYYAEAAPAGDTTVSANITAGDSDGGLMAVVMKAASGAPILSISKPISGGADMVSPIANPTDDIKGYAA
jgi:hypothetical protein